MLILFFVECTAEESQIHHRWALSHHSMLSGQRWDQQRNRSDRQLSPWTTSL